MSPINVIAGLKTLRLPSLCLANMSKCEGTAGEISLVTLVLASTLIMRNPSPKGFLVSSGLISRIKQYPQMDILSPKAKS